MKNYRRYAYVFASGMAKVEWSSEDCASLPERAITATDKNRILDFMGLSRPGSFIKLSTGEMVFQIV
jgi:hypothetical protein